MKNAVVCENLVKDFGDGAQNLRVLHGITQRFESGELSMLIGPSGCGKTTLISIIAGIMTPTDGHVSLFGQDLSKLKGAALSLYRLKNIGFIFQQYNLIPALDAAENACVPLVAAGMSKKNAMDRARAVLVKLGMEPHLKKQPHMLSGGQQQRVAIARALVHEPTLVVCDEPTAALDGKSGHTVMELLKEIAVHEGRACIVVTHDSRIYDFADRIVEMDDGKIKLN